MKPDTLYARALVGRQLCGRWRLVRVLGTGGMSTVFEGVHRNGKRVAIKVLHPELAIVPRLRTRFRREAYVANRVDHPDAVSIVDDDVSDDGLVFLVMEYLEGETLGALMRNNGSPLPVSQVVKAALGVLDVLAVAHRKGVIHRDVKPDNVFVTRHDHRIKLLDFGIASLRELSAGGPDVTGTNATLGTPAFMAPEQARGRATEVDVTTDLWAVGAMMFTLLTGRFVHEGSTRNELLIAAATEPARSVGSVAVGLHDVVVGTVDRALAFEKQKRWPDADSMRAPLLALNLHTNAAFTGARVFAPALEDSTQDEPDVNAEPTSAFVAAESRGVRDWGVKKRWPRAALSLAGASLLVASGAGLGGAARFQGARLQEAPQRQPVLREPAIPSGQIGVTASAEASHVGVDPAIQVQPDVPLLTSHRRFVPRGGGSEFPRGLPVERSNPPQRTALSSEPVVPKAPDVAPRIDALAPQEASSDDPLDRR